MSIKPPVPVANVVVAERREDGCKILTLSTKVGEFEFEFSPAVWRELGETAKWFEKRDETTKP